MIEARLTKPGSDSRSGTSPAGRAHDFEARVQRAQRIEPGRDVIQIADALHRAEPLVPEAAATVAIGR